MTLHRAAALLCAVALPLVPVAAQADSYSHTDASSDMLAFTEASPAGTPSPDQTSGDITASVVRHRARSVVMQVTSRDLVADQGHFVAHFFAIKTPAMRRDVSLFTGGVFGTGGKAQLSKPNGKHVSCRVRSRVDLALHTATVTVPRRCLGNPRWVEVGIATMSGKADNADNVGYADDALRDGAIVGRGPAYSPKVFR